MTNSALRYLLIVTTL